MGSLTPLALGLALAGMAAGAAGAGTGTAPADIGDDWPVSTLAAEGLDPGPVAALLERIDDGGYTGIDSFTLARHGKLLVDRYYGDFTPERLHETRSAFKSITGLLAGIAIDEGFLRLEDPVLPLIARFHTPADAADKQAITVRDLLQMSSGFDCAEMPGREPFREAKINKSADILAGHFGLPMTDTPGTRWRYCSSNTYLLGIALKSALIGHLHFSMQAYLDKRLFWPLGIIAYRPGGYGSTHLAMHGGARMRPRDLAKIGQLLVAGGRWRDRQVVPAAWIAAILVDGVETDWSWTRTLVDGPAFRRPSRYQYQWFQTDLPVGGRDVRLVHGWGNGGQFVVAVPAYELVVVTTGSNFGFRKLGKQKQIFDMLYRYVLPAVR